MRRLFKRRGTRPPGLRVADGAMQLGSLGRLPDGVAAGGPRDGGTPEYIEEATIPTDDVWAREQAGYRERNEERRGSR